MPKPPEGTRHEKIDHHTAAQPFYSRRPRWRNGSGKAGVNSALGISPTTADFVKEAAMSDMMEIESSKIAQQKGNAAERNSPIR